MRDKKKAKDKHVMKPALATITALTVSAGTLRGIHSSVAIPRQRWACQVTTIVRPPAWWRTKHATMIRNVGPGSFALEKNAGAH
jgi:hypothetical protein